MDAIIPVLVALAGSGIWVALFDYLKTRSNKQSADKQMLLGLGHDRIYNLCEIYLNRGYVTLDELENLEYIYKPYKMLGGNGTGERLYEQVNALPHTKKEERDK